MGELPALMPFWHFIDIICSPHVPSNVWLSSGCWLFPTCSWTGYTELPLEVNATYDGLVTDPWYIPTLCPVVLLSTMTLTRIKHKKTYHKMDVDCMWNIEKAIHMKMSTLHCLS